MGFQQARDAAADEEIVRRVQGGDAKLFGVVFDRHYARLEQFLRHLGVPEADLEDVLADSFTRAFERIQSFNVDGGSRYLSYLYAIARNQAIDRIRARGRSPVLLLLDDIWQEPDERVEAPEQAVLRHAEVDHIRRAMARLNASDREIITLSYDRELTCREIMEVMGKPSITSVTTHLYKAMKRLRELVHAAEVPCGCQGG